LVEEHAGKLDQLAQQYLMRVVKATERMSVLIEDLLRLSRITGAPLNRRPVNLTDLAHRVAADIQARDSERQVEIQICVGMRANADARLLTAALENLIGNAWKFTSKVPHAVIQVGQDPRNKRVYHVRDNGAGFDVRKAQRLFAPFQRFHNATEFEGNGIGLSIVHRIISRHGGRMWAEAEQGHGATFFFSLGKDNGSPSKLSSV
jgi:light-regulated signal transduction histidine kinase (bacteriophytochrome)